MVTRLKFHCWHMVTVLLLCQKCLCSSVVTKSASDVIEEEFSARLSPVHGSSFSTDILLWGLESLAGQFFDASSQLGRKDDSDEEDDENDAKEEEKPEPDSSKKKSKTNKANRSLLSHRPPPHREIIPFSPETYHWQPPSILKYLLRLILWPFSVAVGIGNSKVKGWLGPKDYGKESAAIAHGPPPSPFPYHLPPPPVYSHEEYDPHNDPEVQKLQVETFLMVKRAKKWAKIFKYYLVECLIQIGSRLLEWLLFV